MNIAAIISWVILLAAATFIFHKLRVRTGISYRSALVILIAAAAAGLIIMGCPLAYSVYRQTYPSTGVAAVAFFTLFQSIQNAMRTFVLDGSWSEMLTDNPGSIQISGFATFTGLAFNVIAPLLTFSAILTLFKEATSRLRMRAMASCRRPLILFSELNKDTVLLAEDIRKTKTNANLVYTDVYPEDDETNYELREKAGRLHAVMLRTDISELNIKDRSKIGLTEYFLLGHDEEENVMQARKLYARNHNRSDTGIYVLAASKGNALYIDSLTANLSAEDIKNKGEIPGYDSAKTYVRSGGIMRLRRIDPGKTVAWNEIPKIRTIRDAVARPYSSGMDTLSILVFADTFLSFSIVKTLLWYCQSDKFSLELNIVHGNYTIDKDSVLTGNSEELINVRDLIEFECPEIIMTNKVRKDGDAYYDIEFIESAKFESGRFQMQLIGRGDPDKEDAFLDERLRKTDLVIVDRGSDGASIETAAYTRTMFERLGIRPEILTVCADEDEILSDVRGNNFATYKDISYDIGFIGRRGDTYGYKSIRNIDEENLGLCQHIKWADVDIMTREIEPEERDATLVRELINYERHEYYRDSSISKAMYLRNVLSDPDVQVNGDQTAENDDADDDNTRFERHLAIRPEYECLNNPSVPSGRWCCTCEKCRLRRKLEHNRWNAYMRTEGYVLNTANISKDSRTLAKEHNDLIPFNELSQRERDKDG